MKKRGNYFKIMKHGYFYHIFLYKIDHKTRKRFFEKIRWRRRRAARYSNILLKYLFSKIKKICVIFIESINIKNTQLWKNFTNIKILKSKFSSWRWASSPRCAHRERGKFFVCLFLFLFELIFGSRKIHLIKISSNSQKMKKKGTINGLI